MFLSQFYSQFGALITGFLTADLRMMRHLGVYTIFLNSLSHVSIDDIRILAMGHDGERGRSENPLERFSAIYQHITRRAAHEQLDTRNAMHVEFR